MYIRLNILFIKKKRPRFLKTKKNFQRKKNLKNVSSVKWKGKRKKLFLYKKFRRMCLLNLNIYLGASVYKFIVLFIFISMYIYL